MVLGQSPSRAPQTRTRSLSQTLSLSPSRISAVWRPFLLFLYFFYPLPFPRSVTPPRPLGKVAFKRWKERKTKRHGPINPERRKTRKPSKLLRSDHKSFWKVKETRRRLLCPEREAVALYSKHLFSWGEEFFLLSPTSKNRRSANEKIRWEGKAGSLIVKRTWCTRDTPWVKSQDLSTPFPIHSVILSRVVKPLKTRRKYPPRFLITRKRKMHVSEMNNGHLSSTKFFGSWPLRQGRIGALWSYLYPRWTSVKSAFLCISPTVPELLIYWGRTFISFIPSCSYWTVLKSW